MRGNIDRRCLKLLMILAEQSDYITVESLSNQLEQTRRRTQYDLCKVNDLFSSENLQPIAGKRNKGIRLDNGQKKWCKLFLKESQGKFNYVFAQEERCAIIICEYILGNRIKTLDEMVDRLMVSRNTAFLDLKLAREKLKIFKIGFEYTPQNGHVVSGDEILKRSVFIYYISTLYPIIKEGFIDYLEDDAVREHIYRLKEIEMEMGLRLSEATINKLAIMLTYFIWDQTVSIRSISSNVVVNVDEDHVKKSHIYEVVSRVYDSYSERDKVYISIHLLSGRSEKGYYDTQFHEEQFEQLAFKLVEKFERAVGIDMVDRELLIYNLSKHISHSIYRYAYGIIDYTEIEQEVRY